MSRYSDRLSLATTAGGAGDQSARKIASRIGWIDSARGVGIVFVIIGHVWIGLEQASLIGNDALFSTVETLIYSFHMPFLFLLSGIFFFSSISRQQVAGFAGSRVVRLLWPLVLWTWIFFLFKVFSGALANNPVGWSEFPVIPLPPREQFWFLWALFVIQISALAVRPLLLNRKTENFGWAILLFAAVVLYFGIPGLPIHGSLLVGVLENAPYFVLGAIYGRYASHGSGLRTALLASTLFFGVELWAITGASGHLKTLLIGSIASLSLLLIVMAVDAALKSGPLSAFLRLLGQASLAIFVAHVIFLAAVRVALLVLGVETLALHLAAGVLVGIFGPLCLYLVARRLGMERIAGF
jgi:fucose 4-O-acetylase-like acetyltransferase